MGAGAGNRPPPIYASQAKAVAIVMTGAYLCRIYLLSHPRGAGCIAAELA